MADEAEDLEALFDSIAQSGKQKIPEVQETPVEVVAENAAESMTDKSLDGLYAQVGRCTRQLHDAMRQLGYDQMLMRSTNEISSAKNRLEYVAELTEKAANKVLNAIDEGLPEEDVLLKHSKAQSESWERMFSGSMSIEEFKSLAEQSRSFAALVSQTAERQKARMMDIMMSQDFQDITGQIIKKIVAIAHEHEQELMKILRENAPEQTSSRSDEKPVDLMAGPQVPSTALDQDDVDNLLADLGF